MTPRIRWPFRGRVAAESVARGICASAPWLKSKPPTTTPIVYLDAAMRLGNTQGGTFRLTHSGLRAKPVPSPERAIYILEPAGNSKPTNWSAGEKTRVAYGVQRAYFPRRQNCRRRPGHEA